MKKFINLSILFIGSFYLSIASLMAQCPDGCEGTFPNCNPCFDTSTPIDGETGLLLVVGLAVGGYRLIKKKMAS